MVKGDNIQERMIDFAVRIMHLCGNLLSPTKMTDIIQKCQELSRIINASINTAARRL